jgi:ubiquinone/menaquinone biosynthesis C-methylase UbiE
VTTSFTHDTGKLAETYDRLSDSQFEGGKRLVERIGIREGSRVLDVGCGTGRLTRFIADKVGGAGKVVGIDPLPERIAVAREHAPGIPFDVGQAEDLSAFADESFDVVCMSAVFHWFADKPKALAEARRVLRPGGRVGATTMPRELMGSGTVASVMGPLLGRSPYVEKADVSVLPFATRVPGTTDLIAMLLAADLKPLELLIVARSRTHESGAEVVDFLESSSFGNFLRVVSEDVRPAFRADLVAAFDAMKGPEGVVVHDWGMVFVGKRT